MPPIFHVALVEPEIPYNTGNVARLCVAACCRLNIVGRAGFSFDDPKLRRAGLYFWQHLELRTWPDLGEFEGQLRGGRVYLFSRHGRRPYTAIPFAPGDALAPSGSR